MDVLKQWENGILLKTENIRIELFLKEEKQLGKGVTRHFAFLVEDCDEMINRIKQEGYSILMEPKDVCIGKDYFVRVRFCIGPIGEEIEFFQEK